MRWKTPLYLVLDPDLCGGEQGSLQCLQRAIAGGVGIVQLRAPNWKKRRLLALAQLLMAETRRHGIPFVLDDEVDVALACGADGVHVGQRDLPIHVVRRLMGPNALIGLSISNVNELRGEDVLAADYLGIGPVFATQTKTDAAPAIGMAGLHALRQQTAKPIIAIGGINADNIHEVAATGVEGSAVVSAICRAPDAFAASQHLLQRWQGGVHEYA